jgi:hypothetical protein
MNKNITGKAKWNHVAKDFRIALIRQATVEESEGDFSFVMVILHDGFTYDGSERILASSVTDLRDRLNDVEERDDD